VWDLRAASSGASDAEDASDDEATAPKGPRVTAGTYQVKLMVDGRTLTQQLEVKMDPRCRASAAELAGQYRLGQQIYSADMLSRQALAEANSVKKELQALHSRAEANPGLKVRLTAVENSLNQLLVGDKANHVLGLESANTGLGAALRAVESGDRAIPAQTVELFQQAKAAAESKAAEWRKLKSGELAQLNRELQQAGIAPVNISEIEEDVDYLMTR
jgi:hypothetical protein